MSLVVFEVLTLFLSFPVMFLKFETWNLLPACLNVCKMTVRFRVNMLFPQGLSKGFDAMMRHHIAFCTMTLLQYFVFLGCGWTILRHTAQHTHTHTHHMLWLNSHKFPQDCFCLFPHIAHTSCRRQPHNRTYVGKTYHGEGHLIGKAWVRCQVGQLRNCCDTIRNIMSLFLIQCYVHAIDTPSLH